MEPINIYRIYYFPQIGNQVRQCAFVIPRTLRLPPTAHVQPNDGAVDLLPLESAFFSSLCSGFGPLLTVGDTPTG